MKTFEITWEKPHIKHTTIIEAPSINAALKVFASEFKIINAPSMEVREV